MRRLPLLLIVLLSMGLPTQPPALAQYAAQTSPDTTTSLAHHWPLQERSGARRDRVGTTPLLETGTVGTTSGPRGRAALFDGNDANYLETVTDPALAVPDGQSMAVALRLRWDALPPDLDAVWPTPLEARTAGPHWPWWLYLRTEGLFFEVASVAAGTSERAGGAFTPTLGQWYCLVGGYDGATRTPLFSVDGGPLVVGAPLAGPLTSDAAQVHLGNDAPFYAAYEFTGAIDDVRYYIGRGPDAALVAGLCGP